MRRIVSVVGVVLLALGVLGLSLSVAMITRHPAVDVHWPCGRVDTSPPTSAKTRVATVPDATMEYYEVCGSTAAELRASMRHFGPSVLSYGKGPESIAWYFAWHLEPNADGTCRVTSITPEITVIFPYWAAPDGAYGPLVAEWNRYIEARANYFTKYASVARANVPNIVSAVSAGSCDDAVAAAQPIADQITRQGDALPRQAGPYDLPEVSVWSNVVMPWSALIVVIAGFFNLINLTSFVVSRVRHSRQSRVVALPPTDSVRPEL
jgi:predicted secreted Zn-dependent protease